MATVAGNDEEVHLLGALATLILSTISRTSPAQRICAMHERTAMQIDRRFQQRYLAWTRRNSTTSTCGGHQQCKQAQKYHLANHWNPFGLIQLYRNPGMDLGRTEGSVSPRKKPRGRLSANRSASSLRLIVTSRWPRARPLAHLPQTLQGLAKAPSERGFHLRSLKESLKLVAQAGTRFSNRVLDAQRLLQTASYLTAFLISTSVNSHSGSPYGRLMALVLVNPRPTSTVGLHS